MSQSHDFEHDLREMIKHGQVVAVVGSGVSVAAAARSPAWRGLIESGVARCQAIGTAPHALKDHDLIELAGVKMEFFLKG